MPTSAPSSAAPQSSESHPIHPTPLAAVLAWVLPGLGYIARGELARGLAVGGSILALILAGLFIGGPDTIDSREERWWFMVQIAGGPVVLTLDQIHQRVLKVPAQDGKPYRVSPHPDAAMNPGSKPPAFTRSVARVNESARLYIVIAGMLNMIAILDCMAITRRSGEAAAAPKGGAQ